MEGDRTAEVRPRSLPANELGCLNSDNIKGALTNDMSRMQALRARDVTAT